MLSRVAESVYWMFRYMERAQNTARFIDADFNSLLYDPLHKDNVWNSLIAVTGDAKVFEEKYTTYSRENIINFLALDESYLNSIVRCIRAARENARSIREIISSEMWEEINTLYLLTKDFGQQRLNQADPYDFCRAIQKGGHTFTGLFYSTMNQNEAWHFARVGMLLERADKTSRILDVKYYILLPQVTDVGGSYDNMQWSALLKSASGLEMYRKKYRRVTPRDVSEFLMYDLHFPRSIRHCIHSVEASLWTLSADQGTQSNSATECISALRTEIDSGTIDLALNLGLHGYLDDLQTKLNTVDDCIRKVFFDARAVGSEEVYHGAQNSAQSQN
jgi:uncharacterized alpha-E superfamily protein